MIAPMANILTNGTSPDLDLDPRLLGQLGWSGFWNVLKRRMGEELVQTRTVRPLLRLFGNENLDPDAIPDFRHRSNERKTESTPPGGTARNNWDSDEANILSAPAQPTMVSAEISQRFRLTPDQVGDPSVALNLISRAAHRVGLAEDALLLYGADVGRIRLAPVHHEDETFQDEYRNLRSVTFLHSEDQGCRLFHPERARKISGSNSITSSDLRPVIRAITDGIADLCFLGHNGPYCLLVSRLLYTQMYRSDLGTVAIAEILPLLRENGVGCIARLHDVSTEETKRGGREFAILWSNGASAVGLAVPREAHVEFVRIDQGAILCVQERIRLIINNDEAVTTLGPWDISALLQDRPELRQFKNGQLFSDGPHFTRHDI